MPARYSAATFLSFTRIFAWTMLDPDVASQRERIAERKSRGQGMIHTARGEESFAARRQPRNAASVRE
ncbi:MAG: hypothetical protein AB7E74_14530 [Pirellulales bacterium]